MKLIVITILILNLFKYGFTQITCETPNGEEALCKQLIHCPHFLKEITHNITKEQKRFLRDSQCGYTDKPWVCCGSVANYANLTFQDVQFPPDGITASLNDHPSQSVPVDELKNHKHAVLLRGDCAKRIVEGPNLPEDNEGNVTNYYATWTALIQYNKDNVSTGYHCGGTLISRNYIITAAHCVTGKLIQEKGKPIIVRLGGREQDTRVTICHLYHCEPPPTVLDYGILEITPHPDYNSTGHNEHDIALVRIKGDTYPNVYKPSVPICFPLVERRTQSVRSSHYAIGWGITQNKSEELIKRYSVVRELSPEHCVSSLKHHLTEDQFCVVKKTKPQHNCVADDGGSIVGLNLDYRAEKYYLEGIVNSRKCKDLDYPEVYTRIWPYAKWVLDNMKE